MSRRLGVVGGGQLGRFFVESAQRLGFVTMVLDPDPRCPASLIVDEHHCADYLDEVAVRRFGEACDAVTVEFENVPLVCLENLASVTTLRPWPASVAIAADRRREKELIRSLGIAVAPYDVIADVADVERISATGGEVGGRAKLVLKTAQLGYDGKGQVRLEPRAAPEGRVDLLDGWSRLGRVPCVVERMLPLDRELSVVVARGRDGALVSYPPTVNEHMRGILDASTVSDDEPFAGEAIDIADRLARHLDFVGVLAVEFFVSAGRLVVNELAPRPHNSGHWTIDAAESSQFDQQARILADLPLGSTEVTHPGVAMVNLLGDLWAGGEPDWRVVSGEPDVRLHLYGKHEARSGRKMGHLTVVGEDSRQALDRARDLRDRLGRR